ncbi:phosphate acyltransferase PlsX [Thiothrix nivea]|uniref:Phosphate acyltransferase n=1 Tax=Thiothrix nivea (strain ATCC 35100 / DSM 5205 / JP2) TaxID=870187 RepID=A0A656HNL3_THINJ|nr:phosphate acyltransferase PlsX [Thiothrix nivea]EIJ36940.1 phosphate:acyl-(acyl carrier protein) acyltransferase [Thiothrix nivea DSM 5205]
MSEQYRIALDAMGGDHGLSVVVPAALEALKKFDDIALILVGDEAQIQATLAEHKAATSGRLAIRHASQVVAMDEMPAHAMKNKKDSSMRVAINLVKAGEAEAAVSAGNTGALMATARFVLKTLPGIDRPAICTVIPSMHGHTHMLDLGANVDSEAEHLYQFALMGSELAKAIDNNPNPKVGLLNIGQEAIKGNEQVKAANALLRESPLNYIGYVEGDDIYHGDVDVVVCDGFVGNVALKTSEGLAKMVSAQLKANYSANLFTKLAALISLPVLKSFRRKFDPRRYNGASLLGLQGIVVKSHGGADSFAYANAIGIARTEIIEKVPQRINKQLESLLAERQKA